MCLSLICCSRSTLYRAYGGDLPGPSTLDPLPAYAGFKPGSTPLICTMDISAAKPLVDSIFGTVQAGSILSYQQPPASSEDCVINHQDKNGGISAWSNRLHLCQQNKNICTWYLCVYPCHSHTRLKRKPDAKVHPEYNTIWCKEEHTSKSLSLLK